MIWHMWYHNEYFRSLKSGFSLYVVSWRVGNIQLVGNVLSAFCYGMCLLTMRNITRHYLLDSVFLVRLQSWEHFYHRLKMIYARKNFDKISHVGTAGFISASFAFDRLIASLVFRVSCTGRGTSVTNNISCKHRRGHFQWPLRSAFRIYRILLYAT